MAAVLACGPGPCCPSFAAASGARRRVRDPIDVTAPDAEGAARRSRRPSRRFAAADRPGRSSRRPLHEPRADTARLAGVEPMESFARRSPRRRSSGSSISPRCDRLLKRGRGRRGVARLRLLSTRSIRRPSGPEASWSDASSLSAASGPARAGGQRLARRSGDAPLQADFLWRDARLIVEADSRHFHDTARPSRPTDARAAPRARRLACRTVHLVPGRTGTPRLATMIRGLLAQSPADGPKSRLGLDFRPVNDAPSRGPSAGWGSSSAWGGYGVSTGGVSTGGVSTGGVGTGGVVSTGGVGTGVTGASVSFRLRRLRGQGGRRPALYSA